MRAITHFTSDLQCAALLVPPLESEASISMQRYTNELAAGLKQYTPVQAKIAESSVATTTAPGTAYGKLRRYYHRYHTYPGALRNQPASLYHITDHASSYLLKHLPASRTVVTCHDINLITVDEWLPFAFHKPSKYLFRWSMSHIHSAAHIIAVSESTRSDLLRFGLADESQISVVPVGLNPAFQKRSPDQKTETRLNLSLPSQSLLILHVGQDGLYKNFPTVARVVAHLRTLGYDAHLMRAGKPLSGSTESLLGSLLPSDTIHDYGRVSDSQLSDIYAAADCLLFPSLKEGFGWPVLEAMATGIPVVTSNDSALAGLNRWEQLKAAPDDIAGLAAAVMRIWPQSDFSQAVVRQNLDFSSRFAWKEVARSIVEIYSRVGEEPG